MTDTVQDLRQQLHQLRAQHASGALADAKYRERSSALERRLVDLVVAEPEAGTAAQAVPAARPGGRLWAALGGFAVLLAAVGYWWTGSPEQIRPPPPGFGAQADADGAAGPATAGSAPHTLDKEQFTAMTERLAARLKSEPDNAEGWSMLGRSYMALGREAEALAAFEHVLKLRPDDAGVLADYADALAVKNGRSLDGEPTKLVERALKIDPDNLKALMLAGTAAFNRGDYAKAVQYWEHAVQVGPPGSAMVQQARNAVAEARELGKLPATASSGTPPAAATGGAVITGTVSLAPALKGKVAADDLVFIFARPAEGSRMPLAIVRKQVRDLPFNFRLDDSQAMSPATRLSTVASVVVGARVSKSGQAMPKPGDLEGLTGVTPVGSTGVVVVIADEVK